MYVRLALFFLPPGIAGVLLALALRELGELGPLPAVVGAQRSQEILYGPAYSSVDWPFKVEAVRQRLPEVLVLGTSHAMQLRSELFRRPAEMYNAGIGDLNIDGLQAFFTQLPQDYRPRLLLLGVEPWWFHPTFHGRTTRYARKSDWEIFRFAWKQVLCDTAEGKIPVSAWTSVLGGGGRAPALGVRALVLREGYRSDGSLRYGEVTALGGSPVDHAFAETLRRIQAGEQRFAWARNYSSEKLAKFDDFLAACTARGIHVVAFHPPFAPRVYQEMRSMAGYDYIRQLQPAMQTLFAGTPHCFADCSDGAVLGASDDEFVDGSHMSEVVANRLLQLLAERDPLLREYVNVRELSQLLARRKSSLELGF